MVKFSKGSKKVVKTRRYTKAKASVSTVKSIVKREIARNIENKVIEAYYDGNALYTYGHANWVTQNVFPVCPYATVMSIAQGANQQQRIGNQIKTKKLIFSGCLFPNFYNVTTNPIPKPLEVVMWIIYDREAPSIDPVPGTDFIQLGSTTSALVGNLSDILCDVNNDRYRLVARKVLKLGYANYGGTGTQVAGQAFANNDFKLNQRFRFDLTKHYPKIVKYNDNYTSPTSRGLFCVIQPVPADGTVATPATALPCYISYALSYQYEDA